MDLAVSATGTLFYTTGSVGGAVLAELVWVTRDGTAEEVHPGWNDTFQDLALSRDGAHLAVSIVTGGETQIWIKQLDRGPLSKLTFDGVLNFRPAWTPDGNSVAFVSTRGGNRDLYFRRADGTALAEMLRDEERDMQEVLYSDDGEWVVYRDGFGSTSDLHALRLGVDTVPVELVATDHQETAPALSPDGRWLAYVSNETDRSEIYVRPFPNTAEGRWQVSADGGTEPAWAHSGRELFYRNGRDELVRVEVLRGAAFVTGEQQVLFSAREYRSSVFFRMYDVTPDDQRFVMIRNLGTQETSELIVVENLFEELKAKVGN
jgi:Tol biopolymer transport system component